MKLSADGRVLIKVHHTDINIDGEFEIPPSVNRIDSDAFFKCRNLRSITIREGVTSIGERAFWKCSGLENITIPRSVIWIGSNAFSNCSSLTNITIPAGVTSISNNTFSTCSSLSKVTILGRVTLLGDSAFARCSNLANITIPDGVTIISENAFSKCSNLTHITIPDSVTRIETNTFYDCHNLTNITIPNSVTRIDAYAFAKCSNLTHITIPNSVTRIGAYAFAKCSNLTHITIPNGVTRIDDSTFEKCSNLTNITIPNSVTSIGNHAFSSCGSLTDITIPNSVTSIDPSIFEICHKFLSIICMDHDVERVKALLPDDLSCRVICQSYFDIQEDEITLRTYLSRILNGKNMPLDVINHLFKYLNTTLTTYHNSFVEQIRRIPMPNRAVTADNSEKYRYDLQMLTRTGEVELEKPCSRKLYLYNILATKQINTHPIRFFPTADEPFSAPSDEEIERLNNVTARLNAMREFIPELESGKKLSLSTEQIQLFKDKEGKDSMVLTILKQHDALSTEDENTQLFRTVKG